MGNTENIDSQALDALRIQQMLMGNLSEDMFGDDEGEEELDIVIEDEKPKKKTRKKSKKQETSFKKDPVVPELDMFSTLHRRLELDVLYDQHSIPYKEQLWPVPERIITYNVLLTKREVDVKRAARMMHDNEETLNKALRGEIRYYLVVNYAENIPYKVRYIGVIRVEANNGKFNTKVHVEAKLLNENNSSSERVKKSLTRLTKELVIEQ